MGMKVKSLSEKRLLMSCVVNGKAAVMLVDTGATVGLIDEDQMRKYGLQRGARYNGTLIGAGGVIQSSYVCTTQVITPCNKPMTQFILSDITSVKDSIRRETGKEILGIIGLPQMRMAAMLLDIVANEIHFH